MATPRLRLAERHRPLYPLNEFPKDFAARLGSEIVYLLATRKVPRLEGEDWEEIFANIIGAKWKPSNVGLDDIILERTAWGAKTVKNAKPATVPKVRLISGRNSPIFSFGKKQKISDTEPNELGGMVLSIWNERVTKLGESFKHLRTIVLIKSDDLQEVAVFEFETTTYQAENFIWQWNKQGNLEGFDKQTKEHRFTWQPHGSQFTIIEDVPKNRLTIRVKKPNLLNRESVLKAVGFDDAWVETIS